MSRSCFDDTTGDVITRTYEIAFDYAQSIYDYPDETKALGEYCGPIQVSLPAARVGASSATPFL